MKFSVLMSVYHKEKVEYLKASLTSVLVDSTILPTEVVLIKDGPLTPELDDVILTFQKQFPEELKVHALETNQGLGPALNYGLQKCQYEWIARMDTDDICCVDRFEKQIAAIQHNPALKAVGMWITEFVDEPTHLLATRQTPITKQAILQFVKRRNPFNHMTMFINKTAVLKAGGYLDLPMAEDYYLWVRMLGEKFELINLDSVGVLARSGEDLYKRRSDTRVIKSWWILQKTMKKYHMIAWYDIWINMAAILGMTYMPIWLKRIIYQRFLRK